MQPFKGADWPTSAVDGESLLSPATSIAFTEGPAADTEGNVFFSDICNNRIMKFDTSTGRTDVWRTPSGRANGLLFDPQGRLLVCEGNEWGDNDGGRKITRITMKNRDVEVLTDRFEGHRYNAPNDIAATSDGYIFFTDPCYGDRQTMEMQHESVYRIAPDGDVERVLSQPSIQRPNGIAINPSEDSLYLVDSCPIVGGNRKIWAFDLGPDRTPSNQREVIDFAPGRGGDGIAVDQSGNLLIAAGIQHPRGPHESTDVPPGIWFVSTDGDVLGRIPVSEDVLTNLTFGGDDLRTLYVTAGKTLFSIRLRTPGFVVHRP